MKIRQQRGSLQDSLDTTVEIPANRESVLSYVNESLKSSNLKVNDEDIEISFYGYDERIPDYVYMIRACVKGEYYPVCWFNEQVI